MRGIVLLAACATTLAHGAWNGYVEDRDLELDVIGIDSLDIDAGAGSLEVTGDPEAEIITVSATIRVPGADEDSARRTIDKGLVLTLEKSGSTAVLESHFESSFFDWGDRPSIDLVVRVPQRLGLAVNDGSGAVEVEAISGPVRIDDGSGSLTVLASGSDVDIDDGSGSLRIEDAGGNVRVVDGSGSIVIERVAGTVTIDDGSGSIRVHDVRQDLVIEDAGSGGVTVSAVQGAVQQND